jgi:hypothetical protein
LGWFVEVSIRHHEERLSGVLFLAFVVKTVHSNDDVQRDAVRAELLHNSIILLI